MFGIEKKELKILKKLKTPRKIQDFINKIRINFEEDGDTNLSPMSVLEKNTCHCLEGAVLAALALRVNGYPALLIDLKANDYDHDHVVAVFKKHSKWGAISKTNHATLRYRDPIYNSIRELAMSYFHEYYDEYGDKNMRSYSVPVNLKIFDKKGWMATKEEVGYISKYLDKVKHFPILGRKQIANLRKADKIQLKTDKIVEWKSKKGQWYL
ncbi:MAG: hypothetical protein V1804_01075 [Patescibacteria group bacterium]